MEIPDPKILIVQVAGFLLLLLVFKFFLFKPIFAILDARRKDIGEQYNDAEASRKLAEELKAQYEQHLANVEDEMRVKITEAIKEGQTMREEIIADSRTQADRILVKAQEEITREKDIAVAELKNNVATLAVEAAGKLIEEKLDPEKHRQLIGKFVDELGEVSK